MKTSQEQVQHIHTEKDMRNYISLKDGFLRSLRCFTLFHCFKHCIVFLFFQILTMVILYKKKYCNITIHAGLYKGNTTNYTII